MSSWIGRGIHTSSILSVYILLFFGTSAGCTREEAENADRAVKVGETVKEKSAGPVGWLLKQAEREKSERQQQLQKLDKLVAEVQDLLRAGKYDDAEIKAVSITWVPIASANNETEKLLIEQYDQKRKSFLNIIAERRKR